MLKKLAEILHGWNDSLVGSQERESPKITINKDKKD
jgi:hypothetical protein